MTERTNVTFIIPLPIRDDAVICIDRISIPDGWEAEVVDTKYGKMLKLEAKDIKTWTVSEKPVPVGNITPSLVKKLLTTLGYISSLIKR
jgi:hypothetical protein